MRKAAMSGLPLNIKPQPMKNNYLKMPKKRLAFLILLLIHLIYDSMKILFMHRYALSYLSTTSHGNWQKNLQIDNNFSHY